ncbi:MAG TPA: DUF4124 domain-containing protein [Rhodanobacter sp.]|nr:DUF4124 domain-containing protein [Rhodanobacter sp.]
MRLFVAILLLLVGTLACATGARAADTVHRCVDANGSPVFTDQPCAALAATPVQAPANLASGMTSGALAPPARCADTPAALRQRVIAAFAAHDPNQLAGLMVWRGYGSSAAVDDIKALAALVRGPLVGIHFGEDADPAAADTAATPAPAADAVRTLRVRTDGASGRTARFDVGRQAGCLWLRFDG